MRALVDTNVLVYLYDRSSPGKRQSAEALVDRLGARGDAVVSAQTLAEFSAVALRKLEPPLPVTDVADAVLGFRAVFTVLPVTDAVVVEALRGVRDHHLAYFDAQIWAAARLAQCELVLSEDFADGAIVDGVTFVNPFSSPEAA